MTSTGKALIRKAAPRIHADAGEPWLETAAPRAVRQGVSNLIDDYVAVRPGDQVFILYTRQARHPAAWIWREFVARGLQPAVMRMNAHQDIGLTRRLLGMLPEPVRLKSRIALLTVERDTMSHSSQLLRVLAPYPRRAWVMLRLINATEEFFKHALNVTPRTLSGVNGALLTRLMPAKAIHVRSSSGTRLDIEFDSRRYRWISNRGVSRQGGFLILPPGEVSTFPAGINGVLVADGAFNSAVATSIDVRLANHPVTIEIREGRVVSYACANSSVRRLLGRFFGADNTDRVGELGFGTNIGMRRFIPMNSHINERHPGVHIGLGAHHQRLDAVPYQCDLHLDLITSDATIAIENGEVIESEKLARFRNEHHPDPLRAGIGDEDLDADCRG